MATFTSETFTAANGTTVQSLSGWAEHPVRAAGELQIQSNRAYASANDALVYHSGTPASADYSVEATLHVVSLPSSTRNGPVGRVNTTDETYYELVYATNLGRWRLSRVVAGALLEIGSYTQTLSAATSYTVKLEMVGTTIKGYVDGIERISVIDSVAPITAAGKAGYKHGGTAVSTTTGLHVDSLTASDVAAPGEAITYVGAGTASTIGSGALAPTLPAGLTAGDLMVAVAYNEATSGTLVTPSGWTQAINTQGFGGRIGVYWRFYVAGDTAVSIAGVGSNKIGQVAAFSNVDPSVVVGTLGTGHGVTVAEQNIGPIPGITPAVAGAAVLVIGGRGGATGDWTSVAPLSGESLTWTEIGEPDDASRTIGLVWNYAILPGDPVAISDKTFTVTAAATATWRGVMLSLRPAQTVAAPATEDMRVKIAGVFTGAKSVKLSAAGAFTTKPARVIGVSPPPPPPPPVEPDPVTLTAVSSTEQAMALTYTAAPPTYFVFPASEDAQARALSYQIHPPPPGEEGMELLIWEGDQNLQAASEADLDLLYENGIDGFHISTQYMALMGSNQTQMDARMDYCKDFADSHPQFRVTVGVHLGNRANNVTPCATWFDDETWEDVVLPNFQTVAHAVDDSALIGISLDGEDYASMLNNWRAAKEAVGQPQYRESGVNYTDAQVRTKVKARAKSIADVITPITGVVEIYEYFLYLSGSMREAGEFGGVENIVPGTLQSYDDRVAVDWIDGWTSNSQIRFYHLDAAYYKPDRMGGFSTVDEGYALDKANYDSNPKLRKSNSFHSPMIWITEGPRSRGPASLYPCSATNTCADRMFPVDAVTTQLQKARQYTEANRFALYDQGYIAPPTQYGPYFPAIKSASA